MKFFSPQVVMQRLSLKLLKGDPSTGSGWEKSYIDLIDPGIKACLDV
jgi:hypothetical protein